LRGAHHLPLLCEDQNRHNPIIVKYWEIIADNLSKAGWSWGCSSEIDWTGRVLFTADAFAPDGRRFTVLADDRLSAFLELHAAIHRELEVGIKYWEIIADNLKKRGWSLGYVSAVDSQGRTIWIVDAHRDDGKRFNCALGRDTDCVSGNRTGDSPVCRGFNFVRLTTH